MLGGHVGGSSGQDAKAPVCPAPPLDVLYADDALVAVMKPAGLFVHRTRLDRGVRTSVLQQLRDQLGQSVFPVHRLDRATSGVLLVALDALSHRQLSMAFEFGGVAKRYLALVRGWPADEVRIDYPLRRLDDDGVILGEDTAQPATTLVRTLARVELPIPIDRYPATRYALVNLEPTTGRRHQLRRHLKHIGHPILGDTSYGKGNHNRLVRERFGAHRLLLHATRIEVAHPVGGHALAIDAPPPPDFADVAAAMGIALPERAP